MILVSTTAGSFRRSWANRRALSSWLNRGPVACQAPGRRNSLQAREREGIQGSPHPGPEGEV